MHFILRTNFPDVCLCECACSVLPMYLLVRARSTCTIYSTYFFLKNWNSTYMNINIFFSVLKLLVGIFFSCFYVSKITYHEHEVTKWFHLDGTWADHVVQNPAQSGVNTEIWPDCSNQILKTSVKRFHDLPG